MPVTIVFPQPIIDEIASAARGAQESAGVLLCSVVDATNGQRLLARGMRWVEDTAYLQRASDSLVIASQGYVPALGEAETLGATCIWLHTHPGEEARPTPSQQDRIVDAQLADLFRLRSNNPFYGALIVSPRAGGIAFSGFLEHEGEERRAIDRLWQVGDRWRLTPAFCRATPEPPALFDRNIRAFGPAIQITLADLHVGIVGCGGTGSAVSEQLARLGVRQFTLIDSDSLSVSNTTRVYGSDPTQVGEPKAEVLAAHIRRIAPDSAVSVVVGMTTRKATALRLTGCDLVFGCTDDNAGRLVLSRLASYYLIPIIDCGVLLSSDGAGQLSGIDGRVTTLVPGQACLVCRDRIDLARAAAELLTPDERARRVDEGYAPALGFTEPAVVAFTTLVAATAVSELLERLIGYGPEPRPSEVLLRVHEREISTNIALPRLGHYCHLLSGKLGLGPIEPFLEQAWSDA